MIMGMSALRERAARGGLAPGEQLLRYAPVEEFRSVPG